MHGGRAGEGPCAASKSGSGGPPGKRNGQYRHGERTKAAIAERPKFSALLKMLRAEPEMNASRRDMRDRPSRCRVRSRRSLINC